VSAFVDEDMIDRTAKSLGGDDVGEIASGGKDRRFGAEELFHRIFQIAIEAMIAGRFARGGDVQAELTERLLNSTQGFGMRTETQVIAAGEIDQFSAAPKHIGAIDLLKWLGI
jgi:hypothetical protein